MKTKYLAYKLILCAGLLSCTTTSIVPGEGFDAEIDFTKLGMRHGWNIFVGPEDTTMKTQDLNSMTRGKTVFETHCQSCHGQKGDGNGPKAKHLGIRPADLSNLSGNVENYYLVFQINRGKKNMPQWQDILSPQDVKDVTFYIQELGKK